MLCLIKYGWCYKSFTFWPRRDWRSVKETAPSCQVMLVAIIEKSVCGNEKSRIKWAWNQKINTTRSGTEKLILLLAAWPIAPLMLSGTASHCTLAWHSIHVEAIHVYTRNVSLALTLVWIRLHLLFQASSAVVWHIVVPFFFLLSFSHICAHTQTMNALIKNIKRIKYTDDASVVGKPKVGWWYGIWVSTHDIQHLPCMVCSPHAHWTQWSAERKMVNYSTMVALGNKKDKWENPKRRSCTFLFLLLSCFFSLLLSYRLIKANACFK